MSDTIWQTDLVLTAREKEMEGEKKMEKKKCKTEILYILN